MYEDILSQAGLTEDEAKVYETLLEHGPQGAGPLLARVKPMKRGLLYKTLDRLKERGLVLDKEVRGRLQFAPGSPDALVAFAKERALEAQKRADALGSVLPELKAKHNLSSERPVIRFFEGKEGLRELYEDKLSSGAKELTFIRTARARDYRDLFGTWFGNYLERQSNAGMKVEAFTVDDEHANHDPSIDAFRNVVRTWVRPEDYTAPIEIDTYADKVAIISFGKEVFGILIESAPLAMAMRELFKLTKEGAKARPVSHDHPPAKIDPDADKIKKLKKAK